MASNNYYGNSKSGGPPPYQQQTGTTGGQYGQQSPYSYPSDQKGAYGQPQQSYDPYASQQQKYSPYPQQYTQGGYPAETSQNPAGGYYSPAPYPQGQQGYYQTPNPNPYAQQKGYQPQQPGSSSADYYGQQASSPYPGAGGAPVPNGPGTYADAGYQGHAGYPQGQVGPEGERGIGSTVLGGAAGAFIGSKLGVGKIGGAIGGAVLANMLNHKDKKKGHHHHK